MFDPPFKRLTDDEVEELLACALNASGGSLTRETSCWMASVAARHIFNRLATAGVMFVQKADCLPLRD
jgi:hypothetical protein